MHQKINPTKLQAITLRNIPPSTARRIAAKASKEGISLNKAVLRLLEPASEAESSEQKPRTDFSKLAGGWSKEEADEFDRYLAEIRRIDPSDWE